MVLRVWWFVTLLLAALGLVMGGAHLLELVPRSGYDAELYMQVTSTLYRHYGLIGGPVQVLAFILAVGLVVLVRSRASFGATLAGAAFLGISILLWFLLVQPVNASWQEALRAGASEAVQAYDELRWRWEYGHVAAFAAWLMGFALLLLGVFREVHRAASPNGPALEGPKAVGKTETARRRAKTIHELDDPAQRAIAEADPARIRRLSPEEEKKLVRACDKHSNPMLGQIVRLALYTGMRAGEIPSPLRQEMRGGSPSISAPCSTQQWAGRKEGRTRESHQLPQEPGRRNGTRT